MVSIKMGSYYADKAKAKRNAEVAAGDEDETKRQKGRMDSRVGVADDSPGPRMPTSSPEAGSRKGDRVPTTPKPQAKAKSRLPGPPAPKPSTGATREYPKSESSIFGRLFARDDERDRLLTERNTGSYAKGGKVKC